VVLTEIDDNLWALIEPNLPPQKPITGRPRADLRKSFNGILYVLRVGCRWSDVPKIYGAKPTIHRLHLELCESGTYEKIFSILRSVGYEENKLDVSLCSIDTKSIPAKKG
jgi:transposase